MAFDPLGIVRALMRRLDLRVSTDLGPLHLLRDVPGVPDHQQLERERVEVDGIAFEIPTIDALRTMKREAGRDKDRVDLAELEALHEDG